MSDATAPFIHRVVLRNFKSIAACDVQLGPLAFLVGPNGSGKSNFLDALRFVSDALRMSLDHAIRVRGGINEVRRRSGGRTKDVGIRLEFRLGAHASGHYAFLIEATEGEGFNVKEEECVIKGSIDGQEKISSVLGSPTGRASYRLHRGVVTSDGQTLAPSPGDRLFLPIAPRPEYWHLDRMLSAIEIYNLNPDRMRHHLRGGADAHLLSDGLNASSLLRRIAREQPEIATRIDEYLRQVAPGLRGVSVTTVGDDEILEFRQQAAGRKRATRFPSLSMSDGTLRALGILLALFQTQPNEHLFTPPVVGIEEPEVALHPAGAGVLFDALREASRQRQVLVTSHSPDLLDNTVVDSDSILAVVAEDGETHIGPIEEVSRSALRDRLYTVGDLLRMDQLRPATPRRKSVRVRLFSDGAA